MTHLHAPMQQSKLQNYNSARGAQAYKADYQNKLHRKWSDKRERALLHRYFAKIGHVDSILDLPCGHGRLADMLKGHCNRLIEADWSFTMVSLNQRDHGTEQRHYFRASALEIPLGDRSVDVVVSFRLSHHLESQELRERHLCELFRIANRTVIVTWFSATSLKNLLRNDRVRAIAAECGYVQQEARPLFRIGSGHMLGMFTRP
jgi:ubiquinone/menaquinone biosynthesis C-methylase UbiE